MHNFFRDNLREGFEDSVKDRTEFMTEEESAQMGIASIAILVLAVLISLLPFITFNQIMLFMILIEIIAVKDTLRKGLTRVR